MARLEANIHENKLVLLLCPMCCLVVEELPCDRRGGVGADIWAGALGGSVLEGWEVRDGGFGELGRQLGVAAGRTSGFLEL